jgi:hypothetical protein
MDKLYAFMPVRELVDRQRDGDIPDHPHVLASIWRAVRQL